MNTTTRMKEYLEYRKIPTARAEKACGFGNATLVSAFKNPNASLGSDKIEKFLSIYPDLSAEWLLRGTGSMIVGEGINQEQIFKKFGLPANSDKIIEVWMKFMSITESMQELYKKSI